MMWRHIFLFLFFTSVIVHDVEGQSCNSWTTCAECRSNGCVWGEFAYGDDGTYFASCQPTEGEGDIFTIYPKFRLLVTALEMPDIQITYFQNPGEVCTANPDPSKIIVVRPDLPECSRCVTPAKWCNFFSHHIGIGMDMCIDDADFCNSHGTIIGVKVSTCHVPRCDTLDNIRICTNEACVLCQAELTSGSDREHLPLTACINTPNVIAESYCSQTFGSIGDVLVQGTYELLVEVLQPESPITVSRVATTLKLTRLASIHQTCEPCEAASGFWCSVVRVDSANLVVGRGGVCAGDETVQSRNICTALTRDVDGQKEATLSMINHCGPCAIFITFETCTFSDECRWCEIEIDSNTRLAFCHDTAECSTSFLASYPGVPVISDLLDSTYSAKPVRRGEEAEADSIIAALQTCDQCPDGYTWCRFVLKTVAASTDICVLSVGCADHTSFSGSDTADCIDPICESIATSLDCIQTSNCILCSAQLNSDVYNLNSCINAPTSVVGTKTEYCPVTYGTVDLAVSYSYSPDSVFSLEVVPHTLTTDDVESELGTVTISNFAKQYVTCEDCEAHSGFWCAVLRVDANYDVLAMGGFCAGNIEAESQALCSSFAAPSSLNSNELIPTIRPCSHTCEGSVTSQACLLTNECVWCAGKQGTVESNIRVCSAGATCDDSVFTPLNKLLPLTGETTDVTFTGIHHGESDDLMNPSVLHAAYTDCRGCIVAGGEWCTLASTIGYWKIGLCFVSGGCAKVAPEINLAGLAITELRSCPRQPRKLCADHPDCLSCRTSGCVWCGAAIFDTVRLTYKAVNIGACINMPTMKPTTTIEEYCGHVRIGTMYNAIDYSHNNKEYQLHVRPYVMKTGWENDACQNPWARVYIKYPECTACTQNLGFVCSARTYDVADTTHSSFREGEVSLYGRYKIMPVICNSLITDADELTLETDTRLIRLPSECNGAIWSLPPDNSEGFEKTRWVFFEKLLVLGLSIV